ncbi:SNF2 family N-terminal domain-containing protein, partial [Scheffersomyces coipomensis]|uniref:SNF2 family N-terminal domain-containing protein n=1 Tax=Scheffersomyces coipomensis TaxID=1788519 RepID=UPI00315DEBB5
DNKDLQNLIDNIKPDEFLEEGLEPTPEELSINLMKHQRIGLTWLIRMEKSQAKGGILADDMGLGKTIQTIALFIKQRKENDPPTLIVGPVGLLRQWDAEIKSKIKQDVIIKVGVYHGVDKKALSSFSRLKKYDIILTSYGTLSSEWKKHFKESLADAESKKHLPDSKSGGRSYDSPFFSMDARFNRIVLDEAQQIKNKASLTSKCVTYLKAETRFCLSGTPIQNNVEELYPFLRFLKVRPYSNEARFRSDIAIPLKSNNYDDFDQDKSMRKLRAVLRAILLRRNKDSLIDGKPILQLPTKHVESDFVVMDKDEKSFYDALEQGIQSKAKKLLIQKKIGFYSSMLTLLLRLRQACCHNYLVEIGEMKAKDGGSGGKKNYQDMIRMLNGLSPAAIESIKKISQLAEDFSDAEEDSSTCPQCLTIFSEEEPVSIMGTCGHMLCEGCVDAFFVDKANDEDNKGNRIAPCKECGALCKETQMIDYIIFKRFHIDGYNLHELTEFCSKYYSKTDNNHQRINYLIARDKGLTPSAKIEKCIELVKEVFTKYPGEKIIIFSQFTTLFDIMDKVLVKEGIQYLRYDGGMSVDSKNSTIKQFYQSNVQVLLLSLKAGSVGLTLTCASHVVIMDPFWNPFVEEQAMDRAHRIGQEREVHVHRLLISNTVESRIMELQAKKKELISAALDEKGMKSVSRLGTKELGFLFGLNSLQPQPT